MERTLDYACFREQIAPEPSVAYPAPQRPFDVYPLEEGRYLLRVHYGPNQRAYLRVNALVSQVVRLADGSRSLSEITQTVNTEYDTDFSTEDIDAIITKSLHKIYDPEYVFTPKASYLRLRTTLIPIGVVKQATKLFRHLYGIPSVVFVGFVLMVAALSAFFFLSEGVGIMSVPLYVIPATMIVSLILHEIGHASACAAFNAEPGEIGFGFYLFTPVLFANVSDSWRLSKKQRVVVDLAGMYVESFLASLAAALYVLTGHGVFYLMAGAIFFNTILNLNPLLRYDGYWILSDLLNAPNLRLRSVASVGKAGRALLAADWKWFRGTSPALLVYGIAGLTFQVWFLYFISSNYLHEVLYLPVTVVRLAGSFLGLSLPPENFSVMGSILLPMFFYMMIWNRISNTKTMRHVRTYTIQLFSRRR